MSARTAEQTKRMRCYDCGMRISATIKQAKAHGWAVWVGGATCKMCRENDPTGGAFLPAHTADKLK